MAKPLSNAQVENFHRDGYLVLPGFYGSDDVENLRRWTHEVTNLPETPGRHAMYFEPSLTQPGQRLLCRLENFVPYHAGFEQLLCHGRLQAASSQLLGEPAVLFKDKINCKLPGGDGFKPHQDVQAGWDVYGSLHLTAMVAVDPSDQDNGGLEMVAGRHREGLIGQMWAPLSDKEVEGMDFQPVDCQPGDAIFFDSFAPHRSGPNTSDRSRRIIYITYNRASEGDQRERYYADKRASFPQDCERDPNSAYTYKV